MLALVLALVVFVLAALVVGHGSAVYYGTHTHNSFILGISNSLEAFFIRAETVNSNFQRRAEAHQAHKAALTAHNPRSSAPTTAPTRAFQMAGTEEPPSASKISNALANGQDKTEPSQKRRRKSGGNGADARDDAHDRSGRGQPEEEDQGTLGAQGRDGIPLEGVGPEVLFRLLRVPSLCGHVVGKAQRIRTSTLTISPREMILFL